MGTENWKFIHVGLSVKNMDDAVKFFRSIGGTTNDNPGRILDSETIAGLKTYGKDGAPPWKIKIKMLNLGPLTLELTEPVEGDNYNKTYMDEHGEGANHVAYMVDNLPGEIAELEAKGIPAMYASDIYAYMDARKVGGVVIELMQKRDMPPQPPA